MRNRIFKSVVSVVLTLAILISSDSLLWSVFAVDGELPVGLGIYNNVYTSQESTLTKYTIVFKKHSLISEEIRTIEFPSDITLENGKTLTKNDDGSISVYLNKGEQLNLTQSAIFNSAIRALDDKPNIFEITYVTGYVNNDEETSVLYSERTQVYNCWGENSTTNPISGETTITYPSTVEWNLDDPFENLTDTIKQFDSTTMTEVTVEQEWRDRGTDTRPMLENVKVDLYQGEGEGRALYLNSNTAVVSQTGEYVYTVNNPANSETYHAYMTSEQSSSTTYQYTFTVPEFAPDGTAYTYTSDYSDKPEGSTDNRYPVDFKDLYKQGDHPDGDLNKHLAIGLTDFTFTLNWKDAAVPAARPEIDFDYIKSHFKLYNQSGEVPFVPDSISEAELSNYFTVTTDAQTGVTTITVKRLEDLTANGTANEYYVILDSNDGKVDVSNAEGVDQSDYYAVKASNTGIHGSEFDKAYINGAFEMLLTGKTDFTGTIKWEDVAESLTRSQDPEAASLTLWRYLEKDAAHYLDYSAIVTSVTNPQVINGDQAEVTVRFTDLDKYDNTGNSYHYYGVENVTVEKNGTLLPYAVTYTQTETQEGQTVTTETEKLENGGTVTNKLSDKVEFSVSAEWIAAARQGGTASATYQLQRKMSGAADWVPVLDKNGNNMERTLTFDELHMKREGDETCIFEEVDLYDEHGNLYEYRVVQTSVTRKDELPAGDNTPQQPNTNDTGIPCESEGGAVDIEVNDKYRVVTSVDGTDFHFQYNIEGDTKVNIHKEWKDGSTEIETDGSFKAQFTVQNYNNTLLQYVDYFYVDEYPGGLEYFRDYINSGFFSEGTRDGRIVVVFNREQAKLAGDDDKNWTISNIAVPKYDKDGREIAYRPVEIKNANSYPATDSNGNPMSFYSTYAWNVEIDGLTTVYNYVATNHRTHPGDEYAEMAINKEWVDDGEQEYRKPIKIVASENVYHRYENNQPVPTPQSRVLNQSKVWEDRLAITYRYQRDANNNPMTDGNGNYIFSEIYDGDAYDSSDFREMPADLTEGDDTKYYWDKSEISGDDDETKWIRKLLTGTKWGNIDYSSGTELNSGNSTDLIDQNGVKFDDFAGIYKSKSIDGNPQHCHYYAVRQVYDPTGVNGAYATLRFINTRIGVTSYEVKFDWKVGDALLGENPLIDKVTMRISGAGLPNGYMDLEITPQELKEITDTVIEDGVEKQVKRYAYYLLNLPKYDEAGKLIEYKIEEIKIGDSAVNEDGQVRVGSDNCEITVSDETIIEGSEAKTDDLHSITITNKFTDETGITVHKRWADNTNAENTRSDLFIKLHRRSARPGAMEEDNRKEYEWKQSAEDSDNEWSYTFSGLPKYDDYGYPYTYYVTEQEPARLPGYKQIYQCNAPYLINENGTVSNVRNPKVYLDASAQDFRTDVVYDGGIITNRLYGELTINGEKLWKNVSLLLEKDHYPIAHVSLYRTVVNDGLTPHQLQHLEDEFPLSETEIAEGKVLISETDVMNGANSFKFSDATKRAKHIGFVVDDGTGLIGEDGEPKPKLENGNIVLPKYDNFGRAIEYTLEEEPLNGYLSKIEKGSTKIINDFQGGVMLKFDVTKKWAGMDNQEIFPTITFTLFQVFRINNGTEQNPDYSYILMNHFDRVIQSTDQRDVTVTFGDESHADEANYLRYYAPTGEPYIYFVAETLSNYGGDRRIFIDRTNAGYISDYLTQNYPGGKSEVVYLDGNSGQALGFTSTVEQTFGSVEDIIRARVASEPEPTTAEPTTVAADPEVPTTAAPTTAAPTTVAPTTLSTEQLQARFEERVRKALNDKDGDPVELDGAIKNTYRSDEANFHGKIDVSKDWDNDILHEGDQDNFSKVRSYSFTLSRKTEQLSSQTLFRVKTKDSLSALTPGYVVSEQLTIPVPEFEELAAGIEVVYKAGETNAFTPSMTMPDSTNRFGTPPAAGQIPKYFVGVLRKDGKDVTVVVQVGEDDENGNNEIKLTYVNKVSISGFAIYGHDAMKYTYTVQEDNKSGYTRVKSSGSTQLVNDDSNVPEIELENKINVFNIKLHKAFAKEYDDNGTTVIQPLKGTEYNQFFNEANSENSYFGQLKFNLMRSSVTGVSEPVVTVKGTDILTAITEGTHDAQKDSTGYGGYSYTIYNLPITDVSGRYYTYWVEEVDGAQSGANPKVYTVYSDSEFARVESPFNSAHDPNRINMTDNDNGTTKDTYVQNVFKAKQIAVNKYWLDNNNEDGLRPDKLKVYVNENSLDEKISVVFDLELNKEDSVGTTGWKLESALARYYYNGTDPEELKYRITEETPIGYSLVDTPGIYGGSQRTANLNLQGQSNRIYEYGTGWTDYAQADETGNPDTYYLYFRNTAGWSKVNACVWKDGVEMQWPGKTMENLGNDIFRLEVPRDMTYVVFSNCGNSTAETVLPDTKSKIYENGSWVDYNEEDTAQSDSYYYVYFRNTDNWNKVNIYAWDDGNSYKMSQWPGTAMTDMGGGVYRMIVPLSEKGSAHVIFNDFTTSPGDSRTYEIPGLVDGVQVPVSDTLNFKQIGVEGSTDGDNFDQLNLTNYKELRKGQMTLDKEFDPVDDEVKALTRPDCLYFKLVDGNGSDFTDYSSLKVQVMVGDRYVTPSAQGVITVPRNNDYTYPEVNVTNLPLGYGNGADLQTNGSYVQNSYKFVECSDDGSALPETFPYTWSRTSGPEYAVLWNYSVQDFHAGYSITNTLKTVDHTVKKKWNDDNNNNVPDYYKTRPDEFNVVLQRTTDENPSDSSTWVNVTDNVSLKTDKLSLESPHEYSESGSRTGKLTIPNENLLYLIDDWYDLYDEPAGTVDPNKKYIYFYNKNGWEKVNAYMFKEGVPMINRGKGIFRLEVSRDMTNVIFSGKTLHTDSLTLPRDEGYIYDVNNGWSQYAEGQTTASPDTYYVYFNDVDSWASVTAYTWNSSETQMSWPGTEMTLVNEEWGIYRAEVPDGVNRVIFNNESSFNYLPQYDKNGNRYHYRVIETYIGPVEDKYNTSTHTYHSSDGHGDHPASNVYYVDYDENLSDNVTTITNSLIRKTEYQNFFAQKVWKDNYNQDSKRTPVTVVFRQTVTKNNVEQVVLEKQEILNEENNWRFEWSNYPLRDVDGNEYSYSVTELPVSDYTSASRHILSEERTGENSYEKEEFTNTHAQEYKSLKVTKSWTGEAAYNEKLLRPDSITYELYCKYTAYKYENGTIVEDADKSYDGKLSGAELLLQKLYDNYIENLPSSETRKTQEEFINDLGERYFRQTVTPNDNNESTTADRANDELWTDVVFKHLPVYINTCGNSRYFGRNYAIEYYVKEAEPSLAENGVNPYTYGVGGYLADGQGSSTKTNLTNGTAENPDTVTATNELKRRDIPVTKVWNDNGYSEANLHYDIDFRLTCSSNVSGYSYDQTQTLTKDADPGTVTFLNLPKYDSDGNVLNYTVGEKVHVESGTAPDNMYGYERSNNPVYSDGILTAYTITNTLPVEHLKADKLWNDNMNQDGKRPDQLNFTLSRTADGTTDAVKTEQDASSEHAADTTGTNWRVDFGIQPRFNENNTEYVYSVEEAAASGDTLQTRGYTRYVLTTPSGEADKSSFAIKEGASSENNDYGLVTSETVSGVTEKTFHFLNRYTPLKDTLTVNKNWIGDGDFHTWTRPDSVFVVLCYSIDNGDRVNLNTAGNDDPVKKLLKQADANYAFRKEIKATDNWTGSFADLPLNVNPTGTIVFNGHSYQITYSVEEVTDAPLNGYTKNDLASTVLNSSTDDSVTVDNTLKTTTVSVRKVWKDGYEGDQAEHYDVHLILSNQNPNLDGAQNTTLYGTIAATSTSTSLSDTTTEAIQFVVPQYVKGGTAAGYRVDEDVSDRKYGYVTTYTYNVFDTPGVDPVVTVYNTLPLTQVSVTKEWDDESNKYNLRQNINVTLQRKLPTAENWTDCQTVTLTQQDYSNSGNSWTYTFAQLPKFDVNNKPFEYRVVEDKVNAYDTYYKDGDSYVSIPVEKQDNSNPANSNISFDVKNTLITEPITLTKIWDENGYNGTQLRYDDVTITLEKPDELTSFEFSPISVEMSGNNLQWTTTKTVPVYDTSGNPIQYKVTEDTTDLHYGYAQVGDVAVTKTGSHGSDESYFNSYTITNKLPLTDVTAVKHWTGDLELYPNADADVKVSLTRKSNNQQDSAFNSDPANTAQVQYQNGSSVPVTFGNLLKFNYDNKPYTYTVTENTVRGYSTEYANQNVLSTAQNRTVTITNTPKKQKANFVKYDVTDMEKHGSETNFGPKSIKNVEFELYRKREGYEDKKLFAILSNNGKYIIADEDTLGATSTLVTRPDGMLYIENLEPNNYYLKEKSAPTGYQRNGNEFSFTVSIDENNVSSVTYVSKFAYKAENGDLLLDGERFTAAEARTQLTQFEIDSGNGHDYRGIPNEENMSHLTLTKVDANDTTKPLPNATYYLLRLYNFEYKKQNAQGETEQEYLTNALATLGEDYSGTSNLWTYWEKIAVKSTDSDGQITFDGHMFGTYVFYEVKAPTGYERNYTYNATTEATETNKNVLGPIYLDSSNAQHGKETHKLTHLEPRSKAHINVLKTDENGNPLKDAEFKLYRKDDDSTVLTTFTTGYDGMNPTAFEIDTSRYAWGTEFYLIEETPPIGYDANNVPVHEKIEFTLTPELAEEVLHIVRANDVRLKGKVDLTKVSSSQTTTVSAGDPLGGAEFELYAKDGTKLSLYPHTANTNTYRVVSTTNNAADMTDFNSTPVTTLTTSSTAGYELGKLHIEGLDWGDYYLLEKQAPKGYKMPTGEDAKVYFSVGRTNSGSTAQQLTMKNDPDTAALNIVKNIDAKNVEAWGEPVFIFKVKQTKRYDYGTESFVALEANKQRTLTKTISPSTSVAEGYRDSTGKFDVEPGTYEITEMRVARYAANGDAVITETTTGMVLDKSVTPTTATLSVKPGGEAEITFSNQLKTYEKLSHADKKTNSFNGYKALEVHDKDGLALTTLDVDRVNYTVTVPKSELTPQLIRSDGTRTDITSDFSKLVIRKNQSDREFTLIDDGPTITIKGRGEDLAGSSYKLTAIYDGKFTDEFELSFSPVTLFDKTEKTVVFCNDENNRSHYTDGINETNIYSLMFVLETGVPGETVKTVLHNGAVLNSTDQSVFPTPVIERDYSDKWEFDKWSYSYDNAGTPVIGMADSAGLLNVIKNAPNNAEIIVTAVLKVKSS